MERVERMGSLIPWAREGPGSQEGMGLLLCLLKSKSWC
jgi:hypothetical protein